MMPKRIFLPLLFCLRIFCPIQAYAEETTVLDFQKHCEAEIPDACIALGALYVYGKGVEQDYQKAALLYQKACDMNGAIGCNILASNYRDGTEGMPKDNEKALALFQKACNLGEPSACEELSEMLSNEPITERASTAQELALQKSCDLGSASVCEKLPASYPKGSALQKECLQGNHSSCFYIGKMYKQGLRVQKDVKQAFVFLQKSCVGDHPQGCYELGIHHQYGEGTEQSFAEAAAAYQKSCDLKEILACNKAGFIHYQKQQNITKAITYFQKGCSLGDRFACENLEAAKKTQPLEAENHRKCDSGDVQTCYGLGFLYFHGEEISSTSYYPYLLQKDYTKSLALFEKACTGGDAESCRIIGIMHAKGHGLPPDRQQANEYYQKACQQGSRAACTMIK